MKDKGPDLQFWLEAWAAGRVTSGSHEPDITLDVFWPELHVSPGSKVLVPLCGVSSDLDWLGRHGYETTGVEISPIACQRFFASHGEQPQITRDGKFVRWQGERVTVLEGDFFDLKERHGAAVDRAALVAFPPRERARYINQLKACLCEGAPILLVTIEFDASHDHGPPYAVFHSEIHQHFPGAVELSRAPLRQARWRRVGGAEAVVWKLRTGFAHESAAG